MSNIWNKKPEICLVNRIYGSLFPLSKLFLNELLAFTFIHPHICLLETHFLPSGPELVMQGHPGEVTGSFH